MFANHKSGPALALGAAMRQTQERLGVRLRLLAYADDEDFVAGWPALIAEVEAGFRQEESIMDALGCPGLPQQWTENVCALRALHRVTPQVEAGQTALGRQALAALADILTLHGSTVDRAPASEPARGDPAAAGFQPKPERRTLPGTGRPPGAHGRCRR